MSNREHLSEPNPIQPDQPPNELVIARQSLVETVAAHAHARLRHEHPLIKIAASLIETGQVKPPYPTGDGSTLPPKLREYVRRSLVEEALWEVRHSTPQPPETLQ
jgi:hypothetical protein